MSKLAKLACTPIEADVKIAPRAHEVQVLGVDLSSAPDQVIIEIGVAPNERIRFAPGAISIGYLDRAPWVDAALEREVKGERVLPKALPGPGDFQVASAERHSTPRLGEPARALPPASEPVDAEIVEDLTGGGR